MVNKLEYVIFLAKKCGLYGNFKFKTKEIAKTLNISQQSASRILIELESNNYIKRNPLNDGIIISLEDKSIKLIKKYYQILDDIINKKKELRGVVVDGLSQGKYYVSKKEYKNQFFSKLGIIPFHGTLNVKIKPFEVKEFLENKNMVLIKGFVKKNRSFGDIYAYKVKINNLDCAIIIPKRTSHKEDILEIICDYYLREKLNLKTNDEVVIQ
ncbi:MAG: DUF120 domain-containing protein [Candidatus Woesearchaeota archaeon]